VRKEGIHMKIENQNDFCESIGNDGVLGRAKGLIPDAAMEMHFSVVLAGIMGVPIKEEK
jgi:hypothetical protein